MAKDGKTTKVGTTTKDAEGKDFKGSNVEGKKGAGKGPDEGDGKDVVPENLYDNKKTCLFEIAMIKLREFDKAEWNHEDDLFDW